MIHSARQQHEIDDHDGHGGQRRPDDDVVPGQRVGRRQGVGTGEDDDPGQGPSTDSGLSMGSGQAEEAVGKADRRNRGQRRDERPHHRPAVGELEEPAPRRRERNRPSRSPDLVVDVRPGPELQGTDDDRRRTQQRTAAGQPSVLEGEEEREQHHGIREFRRDGEGREGAGEGSAAEAGIPMSRPHGEDRERRGEQVDVCTEDTDGEDEGVRRPDDVDPRFATGEHPPQRPAHREPRGDDDELPQPDGLPQVVATTVRREPLDEGRERPIDARLLGPRRLDPADDGVGAAVKGVRRDEPGVVTERQNASVCRVAHVVAGAERRRERGEDCQGRDHGAGQFASARAGHREDDGHRSQHVGRPHGCRDERGAEREGKQGAGCPTAGAEVGGGGVREGQAEDEKQGERDDEQAEANAVAGDTSEVAGVRSVVRHREHARRWPCVRADC